MKLDSGSTDAVMAGQANRRATGFTEWARRLWYRPRHSRVRFWIFQVHLYSGLTLAMLAIVVGLTGSYIVYKPEMERLSAGSISKVEPAGEPRTVSELYRRAQDATQKKVERLYIWGGPRAAWVFRASRGGREREYIYVDQYRGRVQGIYPMDGTFLQWIYDLHGELLLGKSGLIANGIGALLLLLNCLTGIVVWWPGARRVWQGFRYHWGAKWQIQNYDLHKVLGIVILLALAVLAFTGAYYAFPESYKRMFSGLTHSPVVARSPQSQIRVGLSSPASVDAVFSAAKAAIPGSEVTILTWPANRRDSFSARQWLPGDWARLGDQYVYVDQYSASVLRADASRQLPRAARLVLLMSPLHYGTFAGTTTRLLWILAGLTSAILSVTGFLMWWNRVMARKLVSRKNGFARQ